MNDNIYADDRKNNTGSYTSKRFQLIYLAELAEMQRNEPIFISYDEWYCKKYGVVAEKVKTKKPYVARHAII